MKLARSGVEAHLYMQTVPCETCGEPDVDPDMSIVTVGGELVSRYSGPCPRCQTMREFSFRLPGEVLFPDEEEPEFGDERPSELLDPGDWLWLADLFAAEAPADPAGLDADECRGVLIDLRTAAAAVGEASYRQISDRFAPPPAATGG